MRGGHRPADPLPVGLEERSAWQKGWGQSGCGNPWRASNSLTWTAPGQTQTKSQRAGRSASSSYELIATSGVFGWCFAMRGGARPRNFLAPSDCLHACSFLFTSAAQQPKFTQVGGWACCLLHGCMSGCVWVWVRCCVHLRACGCLFARGFRMCGFACLCGWGLGQGSGRRERAQKGVQSLRV